MHDLAPPYLGVSHERGLECVGFVFTQPSLPLLELGLQVREGGTWRNVVMKEAEEAEEMIRRCLGRLGS